MLEVKFKNNVLPVLMALLFFLTQSAWAELSVTDVQDGNLAFEAAGMAVVWGGNDIDVYYGESLGALMEMTETPEQLGGSLIQRGLPAPLYSCSELAPLLEVATVITVFFPDASTVNALSIEDMAALSARLKSGSAFVGGQGDFSQIVDALELPESDDSGVVDTSEGYFVEFSYPEDDDVREDLIIEFGDTSAGVGEIWAGISMWQGEVLEEWQGKIFEDENTRRVKSSMKESRAVAKTDAPPAWEYTAVKNLKGLFEGGGSANLDVIVWKLETISATNDWYLVKSELQSSIKDFKYIGLGIYNSLGWYTTEQKISIKLNGNARIWDYMPHTAIRNVTNGVDFSIGGDLSAKIDPKKFSGGGGLKANVGFKQSFTAPEIAVIDDTAKATNMVGAHVESSLADWRWYPVTVKNPPAASRSTYNLYNVFIAEVPKGEALSITVTPSVNQRKDFRGPWVKDVSEIVSGSAFFHRNNRWTNELQMTVGGK